MQSFQVAIGCLFGLVSLAAGFYLYRREMSKRVWKPVATVSGLHVYPMKACKGIALKEALCTNMGIEHDRHFVIVDSNIKAVTLRSHPKLALVHTMFTKNGSSLRLSAPGMEPLDIPLEQSDAEAATERFKIEIWGIEGEAAPTNIEADNWICKYLGRDYFRIFRFPLNGRPRRLVEDKTYGEYGRQNDMSAFSDKCPYLMISDESLSDLNNRLERDALSMARFRPNITISGCEPFAEDTFQHLKIGDAEFRGLYRCARCSVPSVDPETGIKDKTEPLNTLRGYRVVSNGEDWRFGNNPVFGMNFGLIRAGKIRVGDTVYSAS